MGKHLEIRNKQGVRDTGSGFTSSQNTKKLGINKDNRFHFIVLVIMKYIKNK